MAEQRKLMDQRIIDLYDLYTHAPLDRRTFLERLATLTGSVAAASALLPLLQANKAAAAQIDPEDERVATEVVKYPGANGELRGYLAKPRDRTTPAPGVVVIHENRGLNPHTEDVARRVAFAGFVALAPDFLSPSGGTPSNEDTAREMIGKLDAAQTLDNAIASVKWLRERSDTTERIGAVGFCWGGGLVGRLAAGDPTLNAGVVFYGRAPDVASVASIKAALLLHYAGLDERINTDVPAFQAALDKAGARYELHRYEGVNHAFHNDTSAARYDAAAAKLAWERTIAFFDKELGSDAKRG
jgi:carboxymethylenebutenolidase